MLKTTAKWTAKFVLQGIFFAAFVLPWISSTIGFDPAMEFRSLVYRTAHRFRLPRRVRMRNIRDRLNLPMHLVSGQRHARKPIQMPKLVPCNDRCCRAAKFALSKLGLPYRFGSKGPYSVDCSGLVRLSFAAVGIDMPMTAGKQFRQGVSISRKRLKTGDLVFFQTWKPGPSHVGIYLKNGIFVHAAGSGSGVRLERLDSEYYSHRYIGAKRICPKSTGI